MRSLYQNCFVTAERCNYRDFLWEALGPINPSDSTFMSWKIIPLYGKRWKSKGCEAWDFVQHLWTAVLLCSSPPVQDKVIFSFILLWWSMLFLVDQSTFNFYEMPMCCAFIFPFHCRCNFLFNNVIEKVLFLTRRREKYLVVAAVRFVRAIISRHVSTLSCECRINRLVEDPATR